VRGFGDLLEQCITLLSCASREAFAICNVVEQHRRIRLYPPKYDDPNLL
jgi:hypothetical protein